MRHSFEVWAQEATREQLHDVWIEADQGGFRENGMGCLSPLRGDRLPSRAARGASSPGSARSGRQPEDYR